MEDKMTLTRLKNKDIIFFIVVIFILIAIGSIWIIQSFGSKEDTYFLIGVSQPNLQEPWRIVMNKEIQESANEYEHIRIIFTDAATSSHKQEKDIQKLIDYGVDLLIVSMNDTERLTPIVADIYKKIPVIVLDRDVIGYDYTLFIGLDNYSIGRKAGNYLRRMRGKQTLNVVEIKGITDSPPVRDRSNGFKQAIKDNSDINIVASIEAHWQPDKAHDKFVELIKESPNIDVVYAHSDAMAFGAYKGLKDKHQEITFIGMDGLQGTNGGLELIRKGILDSTYTCPTGGKEAIRYAVSILNKDKGIPKKIILRSHEITADNLNTYIQEQQSRTHKKDPITLGFAQVGSESSWRLANTESIKQAAQEANIHLIFKNVDNRLSDKEKQKKQIQYMEEFIEQKVDVIAFSPIVEEGWEKILIKAKKAKIPVLLSDREVNVDDSLWTSYMGSDFVEEGRRAARWLMDYTKTTEGILNIVELQGTYGSAPAIGRKEGFEEVIKYHKNYNLLYSEIGSFNYADGKATMKRILESTNEKIHVVYAHNDDMAFGAIEAIEEYGLVAGKDIIVISVDATKQAFKYMVIGKLNCAVECNPLLGPQMMKAVKDLMAGNELPIRIITEEDVYTQENAKYTISSRKY